MEECCLSFCGAVHPHKTVSHSMETVVFKPAVYWETGNKLFLGVSVVDILVVGGWTGLDPLCGVRLHVCQDAKINPQTFPIL